MLIYSHILRSGSVYPGCIEGLVDSTEELGGLPEAVGAGPVFGYSSGLTDSSCDTGCDDG